MPVEELMVRCELLWILAAQCSCALVIACSRTFSRQNHLARLRTLLAQPGTQLEDLYFLAKLVACNLDASLLCSTWSHCDGVTGWHVVFLIDRADRERPQWGSS